MRYVMELRTLCWRLEVVLYVLEMLEGMHRVQSNLEARLKRGNVLNIASVKRVVSESAGYAGKCFAGHPANVRLGTH